MMKACFSIARNLFDTAQIDDLAQSLGIVDRPKDPPHVTLAYSWTPVDLSHPAFRLRQGGLLIWPDAPHLEVLGNLVVLRIDHHLLLDRWRELCEAGAEWDWPTYRPHITLGAIPETGSIMSGSTILLTEPLIFDAEHSEIGAAQPMPEASAEP